MQCRVCQFEFDPKVIKTFERMYGTKEAFDYSQCPNCDCLQIIHLPEDLSRFYPQTSYYSFQPKSWIRQIVRRSLVYVDSPYSKIKWHLPKFFLGLLWRFLRGNSPLMSWIKSANIPRDASILDVGCGAGIFIYDLQEEAFPIVDGIEPFISETTRISPKSLISKIELQQCDRSYDFVMMNHSLEHIPDQRQTFCSLNRILSNRGTLLIRIPVINSALWQEFGVNWVNLDAPRHLYLHSEKSLRLLAEEHGLEWFKTQYDSDEFGIWASMHYQNGHALYEDGGKRQVPPRDIYSAKDFAGFKKKAQSMNETQTGDQACFYFRKKRSLD